MKPLIVYLALSLGLASAAQAGIWEKCSLLNSEILSEQTLASQNQQSVAKVKIVRSDCSIGKKLSKVISVNVAISALEGFAIPNGGFITGIYESLDENLNTIEERVYEKGYFLVGSYFWKNNSSGFQITLEGFDPVLLTY